MSPGPCSLKSAARSPHSVLNSTSLYGYLFIEILSILLKLIDDSLESVELPIKFVYLSFVFVQVLLGNLELIDYYHVVRLKGAFLVLVCHELSLGNLS